MLHQSCIYIQPSQIESHAAVAQRGRCGRQPQGAEAVNGHDVKPCVETQVCDAIKRAAMSGFMTSIPSLMGYAWSTGATSNLRVAPRSVAAT